MKINFDYSDTSYWIEEQIANISKVLVNDRKKVLNKAAKIIKANLEKQFSAIDSHIPSTTANYDGSTPYVHLKDGVKTSVKDDNEGSVYAVIRGDKYTGYKWHLVENGTSNTDALHPLEKALKETENEVNEVIDEMIKKAVK